MQRFLREDWWLRCRATFHSNQPRQWPAEPAFQNFPVAPFYPYSQTLAARWALKRELAEPAQVLFIISSDARFTSPYQKAWRLLRLTSIKIWGAFLSVRSQSSLPWFCCLISYSCKAEAKGWRFRNATVSSERTLEHAAKGARGAVTPRSEGRLRTS